MSVAIANPRRDQSYQYRWYRVSDEYHPLLREIVVVELTPVCALTAVYDPTLPNQFYVRNPADMKRRHELHRRPTRWRHLDGEVDITIYGDSQL